MTKRHFWSSYIGVLACLTIFVFSMPIFENWSSWPNKPVYCYAPKWPQNTNFDRVQSDPPKWLLKRLFCVGLMLSTEKTRPKQRFCPGLLLCTEMTSKHRFWPGSEWPTKMASKMAVLRGFNVIHRKNTSKTAVLSRFTFKHRNDLKTPILTDSE